ncbi:hypothetical protein [Gibbsiella quercinecans]|uniref:hypothetical protein n=1 Tax=Gibbsiella quercinecans TaxID=929813 RepID=UPI00242C1FB7|nr:hypothetical protein [Gibbsiella quercinecans]
MFGLTESHYNIVKRQARNCTSEVKDTIRRDKEKYDNVAAAIISKHHEPVSVLVSRCQFVWLCGYLEGRFGNSNGEYE